MHKLQTNTPKKHHWLAWLIGVIVVLCVVLGAAGMYFFNVAVVPGKKSFLGSKTHYAKTSIVYKDQKWYRETKKQHWYMKSATDNLRLDANYIPKAGSKKTVIILHGYMNNKNTMGEYAAMFHQLGYNTLLPDARAHGQSQGKYIGYGWPERYDVRKWVKRVIKKNGQDSQIVIFGVSMGGATAMMTSGIKLPSQVKAFIEDCGYTDVKDEIEHEAKALYNMPAVPRFPLVEILSLINKIKVGNYLGEASAIKMLHHNQRPMLFIHGNKDKFVPTWMVYQNYQATRGPKELWVTKGVTHAKSFESYPKAYKQHVQKFLAKYVK